MDKSNYPAPPPRKPWRMRWVVVAIIGFIGIYTVINVSYRKVDAVRHPYEEARIRGGHELREIGWYPFPNAYGIATGAETTARLPVTIESLDLRETEFEMIPRDDPRVLPWADHLPRFEQGEQLRHLEARQVVPKDGPYVARLVWKEPDDFRAPQLVVFRQENRILIVPRPPERFAASNSEETLFIIPPEFIETGEYEVFLSTEGRVNRWTFRAE